MNTFKNDLNLFYSIYMPEKQYIQKLLGIIYKEYVFQFSFPLNFP